MDRQSIEFRNSGFSRQSFCTLTNISRKILRENMVSISCRASEGECANTMRDHFTRHLLVEDSGKVVGIVSMRDVIQLMLDEKQFLIEQLQTYIDGR